MSRGVLPHGYPPFRTIKADLPEPQQVRIGRGIELETIHLTGSPPPIVYIHGGLGSLWNPYLQLHAFRDEYEQVSYSLAGNGRSTDPPQQSVENHVADLAGLLAELGVDRPVLHGWSYGTAIALEYAKRHPVAGVILHGGGSHDLTPSWEKPLLKVALALRLYRLPANRWLTRQLAYRAAVHPETPRAVVEDFLETNPVPRRRSAWETVTHAFWGYDGRADLERVDVPTLVISGPADRIVPARVALETAAALPNAVFYQLQRTGHIAPAERPDVYNQLVSRLIEATNSTSDLHTCIPNCI